MIEFDLLNDDINVLIQKLEEEKNKEITNFKNAIYDLALYGRNKANQNANAMVSGEEREDSSDNQLKRIRETKYTVSYLIYNPNDNATYAEFGTGLVGFISPYSHPTLSWKYDVNNHYEWGWYYTIGNGKKWTMGIPSQPFYFISSEELENECQEFIAKRLRR